MSPIDSCDDQVHRATANTIFPAKTSASILVRNVLFADLLHSSYGNFSPAVTLAMSHSAFSGGVRSILGLRAFDDMFRIKAGTDITSVQAAGCRPVAIGYVESKPMNEHVSPLKLDRAIAVRNFSKRPKETFVRRVFSESFKEPGVSRRLSEHRCSPTAAVLGSDTVDRSVLPLGA
jgi:hypothetical protein